jgi:hypothetical protein
VNAGEIVRAAQKVGFEVVVSEGTHEVAPFAELANTCDAMLGVHGAGLTNMVFLPTRGVVIQVVPLGGLEFVAGYFRTPSRDMGLKYLEYRIAPAESTLTEQYPPDHPIFTDPDGVKSKGWESLKQVYLDKQDVRLDLKRFRPLHRPHQSKQAPVNPSVDLLLRHFLLFFSSSSFYDIPVVCMYLYMPVYVAV